MDTDIHNDLKDVGRHVQDIGRFISSPKRTATDLEEMSKALLLAAETVDTYTRIQQMRDERK